MRLLSGEKAHTCTSFVWPTKVIKQAGRDCGLLTYCSQGRVSDPASDRAFAARAGTVESGSFAAC